MECIEGGLLTQLLYRCIRTVQLPPFRALSAAFVSVVKADILFYKIMKTCSLNMLAVLLDATSSIRFSSGENFFPVDRIFPLELT